MGGTSAWVAREGVSEEVTFKQRLEWGAEGSHAEGWGRVFQTEGAAWERAGAGGKEKTLQQSEQGEEGPGMVDHICNPSTLGGQSGWITLGQEFETSLANMVKPHLY